MSESARPDFESAAARVTDAASRTAARTERRKDFGTLGPPQVQPSENIPREDPLRGVARRGRVSPGGRAHQGCGLLPLSRSTGRGSEGAAAITGRLPALFTGTADGTSAAPRAETYDLPPTHA